MKAHLWKRTRKKRLKKTITVKGTLRMMNDPLVLKLPETYIKRKAGFLVYVNVAA